MMKKGEHYRVLKNAGLPIGETAFNTLSQFKHPLLAGCIRHPANGGKAGFIAGMKSFGI